MTLEERVLRVGEAAELLGVAASTYYAAARRGEVPLVRIGRRCVVPGAALRRLLEGGDAMPNNGAAKDKAPERNAASKA